MTVYVPEGLKTARLTLRQLQPSDYEAFAAIHGDPYVMRYIGSGTPLDRGSAWRTLAMMMGHWQLRGYGMWGVVDNITGLFIGRMGLYQPAEWPGLELGWVLARHAWGRGYGTEGSMAILKALASHNDCTEIVSLIQPDNIASVRLAERIGETLQRTMKLGGVETLVYGMTIR